MNTLRRQWIGVLATIIATVSFGLALNVDTTDDGNGHKTTKVTFHVNEAEGDGQPTKALTVPAPAITEVKKNLEADLKDETPVAAQLAVPGDLKDAQDAADRIAETQPALPTAGASAGFTGCVTRFVQNQSSRHGVRPQLQVLHYTVSPNRPGWSDVNAVGALFDRPSSQASSHFVIDGEGHCAYTVPIEAKAWTQAAGNPFSISYEIINSGRESIFLAEAGLKKLRSVMRQVSARTGIPMRAGLVSGCSPVRSGTVQHKDFGICGGGHVDITPFSSAAIVKVLSARQPVSKKVKWARRHARTHSALIACRHRGATPECQSLRSKNRVYHQLLSR